MAPGPNRIGRIVLDGLTGPVTIKGQLFNAGATMTPWRATYNDEQIAAVLSYVRQQWGNNAPPIKPEQIKAIRAETASHAGRSWTADELQQIPPQ
jgi:mono/diheme cytochrome c family protein